MHCSISSIYFLLVLSVVSLVMNKILPIILVVVLFSSNVFAEKYQSSSGFIMSIEGYMFLTEIPSDLSQELGEMLFRNSIW